MCSCVHVFMCWVSHTRFPAHTLVHPRTHSYSTPRTRSHARPHARPAHSQRTSTCTHTHTHSHTHYMSPPVLVSAVSLLCVCLSPCVGVRGLSLFADVCRVFLCPLMCLCTCVCLCVVCSE
jgi:hypothetical protein